MLTRINPSQIRLFEKLELVLGDVSHNQRRLSVITSEVNVDPRRWGKHHRQGPIQLQKHILFFREMGHEIIDEVFRN